jgi:hypothetical protein
MKDKDQFSVPLSKVASLVGFARDIMKCWPDGDVDGGYLQDIAERHGLLIPEARFQPCGEGCTCSEYGFSEEDWSEGVWCFRMASWLKESNDDDT